MNREVFGRMSETNLRPIEYYDLVRQLNITIQHELAEKLEHATEHLSKVVTFVSTGSDARLEKGSMASPLELIALVNADIDPGILEQSLNEALSSEEFQGRIFPVLDIKGPAASMMNYRNDPTKLQPGRIADSRLIAGRQQDVLDAKQRLGEEIIAMPNRGVEKIAALARDARHATEKGTNRIGGIDRIHFDIDAGIVYYNPSAGQLSFKIGPLRLVQNKLLVEEVRHVRNEKDAGFFGRLSSSIEHRLDQLAMEGRLTVSRAAVRELQGHYAFFLKLYHRSEQAYEGTGHQQVAIQLTHEEIREVAKRIQSMKEILEKVKIVKPGAKS